MIESSPPGPVAFIGDRETHRAPAHSNWERAMQAQRRRFKQAQSLNQRLLDRVKSLREEARLMKPGLERDVLLRKARQSETAANIDEWLSSPGLKPPA